MKRIKTSVLIFFIFSLIFSTNTFGRKLKWRGSGDWRAENRYIMMFDSHNVENIIGEVITVEKFVPIKGMSSGIFLIIKTEKEIISIHLGPSWYIENQDIKIEPKEMVEIKGRRINFNGKQAIIAGKVEKGNKMLRLRDENGLPVWIGWKKK